MSDLRVNGNLILISPVGSGTVALGSQANGQGGFILLLPTSVPQIGQSLVVSSVYNGNTATLQWGAANAISFNGRTGAILPQSGDYSYAQISGTPPASQLPQTFTPVLGGSPPAVIEVLTGYNASTGLFSTLMLSDNDAQSPQTFAPVLGGSPPAPTEFLTGYDASTGLFSAVTPSGVTPGGAPTQIQYNLAGAFAGIAGSSVDTFGDITIAPVSPSQDVAFSVFGNTPSGGIHPVYPDVADFYVNGQTSPNWGMAIKQIEGESRGLRLSFQDSASDTTDIDASGITSVQGNSTFFISEGFAQFQGYSFAIEPNGVVHYQQPYALSVTGDSSGSDIQEWYTYGTFSPNWAARIDSAGALHLGEALYDGTASPGTSGQVLSSTVTGTLWQTPSVSQLPQTFTPVLGGSPPAPTEFLTGYNASTGLFSAATSAAGTIGGSIAATQVAFGNGTNTIRGDSDLTFVAGSSKLTVSAVTSTNSTADLFLVPRTGNSFYVDLSVDGTGTFAMYSGVGYSLVMAASGLTVLPTGGVGAAITMYDADNHFASIGVATAAGSPNRMNLPTTTGTAGQVLTTNGANPQQLSWTSLTDIDSFNVISSGTNTTATMIVGPGAVLTFSGAGSPPTEGEINANFIYGVQVSATAPTTGQVLTATSSTSANWQTPSGGTTQTIASGSVALGTSLIASGASATVVTAAATGALTTDNLMLDFNSDPTGVVGYQPSASGMLTIIKWVSAGQINIKVVNNTGAGITPGAITLNYRIVR